ncbi:unnamed protein product, partial [Iphiclides podalirius]
MAKCNKCNIQINKSDEPPAVSCSKCSLYWHVLCAGLRCTPRDKLNWRCDACRLNQSKKTVKSKVTAHEDSSSPKSPVVIEGEEIVANIKDLRQELESIKKDMNEKAPNIQVGLEKRIEIVEAKLMDLENLGDLLNGFQVRVTALEECNNYLEQCERVNNLEVHGLAEQPNEQPIDVILRISDFLGIAMTRTDIR